MKNLYYLLLMSLFFCQGCQDDLTIRDAIDLGEYEGNFMELKSDVKEVTSPSTVLSLEEGIVELSKDDIVVMDLELGDLISNFDDNGIVFWTRVGEIVDNGNSVSIIPGEAGIPDVFKRIHLDTRKLDEPSVILRSPSLLYNAVFAPNIPFVPEFRGISSVDGELSFEYNDAVESFVIVNYNESTMEAASLRLIFDDVRITGAINASYAGQVSVGHKKNEWLGAAIPVIPLPYGLAIFLDVQTFAGVKFKGTLTTPTINFDTGTFDVDVSLSQSPLFAENSINGFSPTTTTADSWVTAGSGEFTLDLIFELTIRPTALTSVKAGVAVGTYVRFKGGIPKAGEAAQGTEIEVDAGVSGKALFSASMLGVDSSIPFIGNFINKFGFALETETYRYPLYSNSFSLGPGCQKQDPLQASLSSTTLELNLGCIFGSDGCNDEDRYRVWFNDRLLTTGNNDEERLFEYNASNNIPLEYALEYDNSIVVQDVTDLNCMQCVRFNIFSILNNRDFCTSTFTDPRNNEEYCLVTIGDQTWMAENLRYDVGGIGIMNTSIPAEEALVYGSYYTWDEVLDGDAPNQAQINVAGTNQGGTFERVQGICPDGYHLPTIREYQQLVNAIGGLDNLKMKSQYYWPTGGLPEEGTFNLVSSGTYIPKETVLKSFLSLGKLANLWTSNQTANIGYADKPTIFSVSADQSLIDAVNYISATGNIRYPCRCIQD